jgi:mRNA interferase RelE/StbE
MLKLDLTHSALDFLENLPAKQFKQLVNAQFSLLKNPTPHDSQELKGSPYRRVDCGEYRIIYQIQEDDLQVILIGKRNDDDVYKKLKRLFS